MVRFVLLLFVLLFSSEAALADTQKTCSFEIYQDLMYNEGRGVHSMFEEVKSDSGPFQRKLEQASKCLELEINERNRSRYLLSVMRVINQFHDEDKKVRFSILQHLSFQSLYDLVWLWQRAIYTSSYYGVMDYLKKRWKKDSIKQFQSHCEITNFEGMDIFLQTATRFGTHRELLNWFEPAFQLKLVGTLYDRLKKSPDNLHFAISLALIYEAGDSKLREYCLLRWEDLHSWQIQEKSQSESAHEFMDKLYEDRVKFYRKLKLKLIDGISDPVTLLGRAFYTLDTNGFIAHFGYSLKPLTLEDKLSREDLENSKESIIFRYTFFRDGDGYATYHAMKRHYQVDVNYESFEDENLFHARSKEQDVSIIGNRSSLPFNDSSMDQKIVELGGNSKALIFRGHSYHFHRVEPLLNTETRFLFMGSCGGFHEMVRVLNQSPKIQLIFSKAKGVFWVNEMILRTMQEKLINGEDVVWSKLREEVKLKLQTVKSHIYTNEQMISIFEDYYTFPDQNVGLAILKEALLQSESIQLAKDPRMDN